MLKQVGIDLWKATAHPLQVRMPWLVPHLWPDPRAVFFLEGGDVDEQADGILSSFEWLGIALEPVRWQQMLPLAVRFDRSAYDAAYLALAQLTEQDLITGDSRMYNAVHEHLDWVHWIGNYPRVE